MQVKSIFNIPSFAEYMNLLYLYLCKLQNLLKTCLIIYLINTIIEETLFFSIQLSGNNHNFGIPYTLEKETW